MRLLLIAAATAAVMIGGTVIATIRIITDDLNDLDW